MRNLELARTTVGPGPLVTRLVFALPIIMSTYRHEIYCSPPDIRTAAHALSRRPISRQNVQPVLESFNSLYLANFSQLMNVQISTSKPVSLQLLTGRIMMLPSASRCRPCQALPSTMQTLSKEYCVRSGSWRRIRIAMLHKFIYFLQSTYIASRDSFSMSSSIWHPRIAEPWCTLRKATSVNRQFGM